MTTMVHALHEGRRLCAPEDPTVPGSWPPGHIWAGVADWPDVEEQEGWTAEHRRCPRCDAVVRRAHADGRPVGQAAEQVRAQPPPCPRCERMRDALLGIRGVGFNEDCMFCGFKDKRVDAALKADAPGEPCAEVRAAFGDAADVLGPTSRREFNDHLREMEREAGAAVMRAYAWDLAVKAGLVDEDLIGNWAPEEVKDDE